MSFDKAAEQFAYALGTTTGIISNVSPAGSMTITGVKFGARFGKSLKSFGKGGWYNPGFYANSLATGLSGTSLVLQASSYACPLISLPLYAASQACGATADAIDGTLGWSTYFF